MYDFLMWGALLLILWGLIGLVKPDVVRLPSRWAALSIGTFSFIIAGIAMEFFPEEKQADSAGMTIAVLLSWLFCVAVIVIIRIAIRAQILSRATEPTARNSGFVERTAMRWGSHAASQRTLKTRERDNAKSEMREGLVEAKQKWEQASERLSDDWDQQSAKAKASWDRSKSEADQKLAAAKQKREQANERRNEDWEKAKADLKSSWADLRDSWKASPSKPSVDSSAFSPHNDYLPSPTDGDDSDVSPVAVTDRLEEAFERYRRREINIWDYEEIVTREDDNIRDKIEDLRAEKRALPRSSDMRDIYDYDIEEARESLEETKWRLNWIKKIGPKGDGYYPSDADEIASEPEPDGSWAHFDYTNDYGTKSYRKIINWTDRGFTLTGYDPEAGAQRSFNKSSIENLESSAPLVPIAGIAKPSDRYGPVLQGPVFTEISFDYQKRGQGLEKVIIANWIEYEKHIAGWDHKANRSNVFVKKQVDAWHGDAAEQIIGK